MRIPFPNRRASPAPRQPLLTWGRTVAGLGTQIAVLTVVAAGLGAIAHHASRSGTLDPVTREVSDKAGRASATAAEIFVRDQLHARQGTAPVSAPAVKALAVPAVAAPVTDEPLPAAVVVAALSLPGLQTPPELPAILGPTVPAPDSLPVLPPVTERPTVEPAPTPDRAASMAPVVVVSVPAIPIVGTVPPTSLPSDVIVADGARSTQLQVDEDARAAAQVAARAAAAAQLQAKIQGQTQTQDRTLDPARSKVDARAEEAARKDAARRVEKAREANEKARVDQEDAKTEARARAAASASAASAVADAKARQQAASDRRERDEAEERAASRRAEKMKSVQRTKVAFDVERYRVAPRPMVHVRVASIGGTRCAATSLPRNWIGGVLYRSGYRNC